MRLTRDKDDYVGKQETEIAPKVKQFHQLTAMLSSVILNGDFVEKLVGLCAILVTN